MSAADSASGGQASKVSHFPLRALPPRAEVRAAAAGSVLLAVACLISYWLTTRVLSLVYSVSKDDDALGGMWAVIATVFLVAAWLGLRAIRPLIRPPESPSPNR